MANCSIGQRWSSDMALLRLWCRLAAISPRRPLACELPYAMGVALKRHARKKLLWILEIQLPKKNQKLWLYKLLLLPNWNNYLCWILLCTQLLTKDCILVKYGVIGILVEATFLHYTGLKKKMGFKWKESFKKAP